MLTDHIDIQLKHEEFVRQVCKTTIVYALESEKEGLATSSSNNFEDENGEPVEIICFWSEKAYANSCKKDGWKEYKLVEISLSEFIENWCIGMDKEGILVGPNFDQNMFGHEIDPLELILELVQVLQNNKSEIEFLKFENLDDLEYQIKEVLE